MRAAARALVGLVGLGLFALWLLLPGREPTAGAPAPQVDGDVVLVPGESVIETRPAGAADSGRDALDPRRVAEAYSFEGRGRIRGRIGAREGAVFPLEWDLVLEPHPYLKGRERAESRRIPFRAGERDFVAEDLALGGYRVRAEASGLNSSEAPVLLVKGSADQFVELAFSPSGWLDGSLSDSTGAPAEGIEVRLSGEGGKLERTTLSDAAGAFQFRALLDGDYELSLRAGGCVFGEPRLVSFRAPRLSLPALQLPPTGALDVHVFDLLGKPAAGVRVTGFTKPAGTLDLRTDEQGLARLRWIHPGSWELQALDESEGLSARGEVQVDLSGTSQLSLRLAR